MKVINKTTDSNETSVEIDLFEGKQLPSRVKKRIQEDVGNFLVENTLISMGEMKSPVQGESIPALTSLAYKKKKKAEVGSTKANLEFEGLMKEELDFEPSKNGIHLGVYGERAPAADGHNNLSGKSELPKRRFLPDVGQSYKKSIAVEVERIIADAIAEEMNFKARDFKYIETKKDLYEKLKSIFGDMSKNELQLAVFRSEELTVLFKELDLMRLL